MFSGVDRKTINASGGSLVPRGDLLSLLAVEGGWTPDVRTGEVWK